MGQYYFHMRDGSLLEDLEGREIAGGLEAVREEALADAREVIAECARAGVDATGRVFEIADKTGQTVLRVPFRDSIIPEHFLEGPF